MLSPSALTSIESETSALLFKIKFSESGMSHLLESLIGANWKKAEEFDDPARSDGILGVHSTSPVGWGHLTTGYYFVPRNILWGPFRFEKNRAWQGMCSHWIRRTSYSNS